MNTSLPSLVICRKNLLMGRVSTIARTCLLVCGIFLQHAFAQDVQNHSSVQKQIVEHIERANESEADRLKECRAAIKIAEDYAAQNLQSPKANYLVVLAHARAATVSVRDPECTYFLDRGIKKCDDGLQKWPGDEDHLRGQFFLNVTRKDRCLVEKAPERATQHWKNFVQQLERATDKPPTAEQIDRSQRAAIILADLYHEQGRDTDAGRTLDQCFSAMKARLSKLSPRQVVSSQEAINLDLLAKRYCDLKSYSQAADAYLVIERAFEKAAKDDSELRTTFQRMNYLQSLLETLFKSKRFDEFVDYFEIELKLKKEKAEDSWHLQKPRAVERCLELEKELTEMGVLDAAARISKLRRAL